jgi:adhesin transport system membrane fusion protein
LQAILPTIETRLTRAVLVAPERGIVNRVLATTRGGLARAGEPLVEIVPIDDELLVEAYLTPADVAFVRAGQEVRVNITAYDPSRYGAIDGRILRVGADAVTRPDREEQAFVVEIEALTGLTDAAGEAVDILPGMVAQVDILSGRRTVLDYLIAPVVRVKETAFQE